jgi:hypothetical protein
MASLDAIAFPPALSRTEKYSSFKRSSESGNGPLRAFRLRASKHPRQIF